MTAPVDELAAVPLVSWREPDARWLAARRTGISASDVAAVLGFGPYKTPWEVWADKTGARTRETDAGREAIRLGNAMEPWLLAQARHLRSKPSIEVARTGSRLYAHPQQRWALASPDGVATDGGAVVYGIEAKTAGLASGYGTPDGWSDTRAPLGYEMQCRWQMYVLGWPRVQLVALVAGLGLRTYTYERDVGTEADMVAQVAEWRQQHLVRGDEPPMGPADNALMDATHPTTGGGSVRLDDVPDLAELLYEYTDGLSREAAGRALKEAATARIKRLLGDAAVGTVGNREVVTWQARRGGIDYPALIEDLIEIAGWSGPLLDMDEITERYRRPDTRSINVKGMRA